MTDSLYIRQDSLYKVLIHDYSGIENSEDSLCPHFVKLEQKGSIVYRGIFILGVLFSIKMASFKE